MGIIVHSSVGKGRCHVFFRYHTFPWLIHENKMPGFYCFFAFRGVAHTEIMKVLDSPCSPKICWDRTLF